MPAENFPNLGRDLNTQIHEAHMSSNKFKSNLQVTYNQTLKNQSNQNTKKKKKTRKKKKNKKKRKKKIKKKKKKKQKQEFQSW